jgi:hypothetical protein
MPGPSETAMNSAKESLWITGCLAAVALIYTLIYFMLI